MNARAWAWSLVTGRIGAASSKIKPGANVIAGWSRRDARLAAMASEPVRRPVGEILPALPSATVCAQAGEETTSNPTRRSANFFGPTMNLHILAQKQVLSPASDLSGEVNSRGKHQFKETPPVSFHCRFLLLLVTFSPPPPPAAWSKRPAQPSAPTPRAGYPRPGPNGRPASFSGTPPSSRFRSAR